MAWPMILGKEEGEKALLRFPDSDNSRKSLQTEIEQVRIAEPLG